MNYIRTLIVSLIIIAVFSVLYFRFNGPWHYMMVIIVNVILCIMLIVRIINEKRGVTDMTDPETDLTEHSGDENNPEEAE